MESKLANPSHTVAKKPRRERHYHSACGHDRSRAGITNELLTVRFESGLEEQNDGRNLGKEKQLRRHRQGPAAGLFDLEECPEYG